MAFDPHMEDYQRLGLRLAASLDASDPFGAMRSMGEFGRRFSKNRDSLPQSDEDRAFRLVARATDLIDYELPFVADVEAPGIVESARRLLDEALALDADCHDARRMLAAADNPSFEDFYRFLADGEAEVRADCERAAAAVELPEGDMRELGLELAWRPWERWVASLAAHALECGHYRKSVAVALELLEHDTSDPCGVALTLALALAKLEDAPALAELERTYPSEPGQLNPWYALARLALAFKARTWDAAQRELAALLTTFPHAALTLLRQDWLPEGVFSRVMVQSGSEDELILAVSEATVILQEGCDSHERGTLGSWIAEQPEVARRGASEERELGQGGMGR